MSTNESFTVTITEIDIDVNEKDDKMFRVVVVSPDGTSTSGSRSTFEEALKVFLDWRNRWKKH